MCWYWPLVIRRSTQPTDALLTATITSRGAERRGIGRGHRLERHVLVDRLERILAELRDDDAGPGHRGDYSTA